MKRGFAILLSLLLLLGLTACGGSSDSASGNSAAYAAPSAAKGAYEEAYGGYWQDNEMPMEAAEAQSGTEAEYDHSALPDGVKMIYRANMELETTEFDRAAADIKELTSRLGGYFEQQSAYNRGSGYRSADYTVRVPANRFTEFLDQLGNVCTVTYATQSAEDISEVYYDTSSRLETAKIKLDRLQELLAKADEMEAIIALESAISDTEYQIESLSGELRHYDALVGYSTIHVTLQEVYRVTEPETAPLTLGQRLSSAFRDGLRDFGDTLEDFAEWLAYSWLSLLVLAAVVFGVYKLLRRIFRGRRRKKESAVSAETAGEKDTGKDG